MADGSFSTDFGPANRAEWLKRAEAAAREPDILSRLRTSLPGGIEIEALYAPGHGPRAERSGAAPWILMQRVDHPDPIAANAQALADLEAGATGLALVASSSPSAHGFGLRQVTPASFSRALKDIRLDAIALRLDAGSQGRLAADSLSGVIAAQPIDPARLNVAFGLDPIGVLAHRGYLEDDWKTRGRLMAETCARLSSQDFRGPFANADGRIWHDAGATEAQELGCVLATAVAYLRSLEAFIPDRLATGIGVTLAADKDMFLTLAKFRAMRRLWARLLEACGLPDTPLSLNAETAWRMMAKLDPHTNILRADAAVFAAGLGGADAIAVLPFSLAQGLPDAFARRVARNVQTVLQEESNLWRVSDPASGSGYVEALTEQLCERGWSFFQTIESKGGIVPALNARWLQAEISQSAETLAAAKPPIIGTSLHRLPKEYEAAIEAVDGEAVHYEHGLRQMRLAEAYEVAP